MVARCSEYNRGEPNWPAKGLCVLADGASTFHYVQTRLLKRLEREMIRRTLIVSSSILQESQKTYSTSWIPHSSSSKHLSPSSLHYHPLLLHLIHLLHSQRLPKHPDHFHYVSRKALICRFRSISKLVLIRGVCCMGRSVLVREPVSTRTKDIGVSMLRHHRELLLKDGSARP
jgi:hypothetical protein